MSKQEVYPLFSLVSQWSVVEKERMHTSKYGSLVFVGVFASGIKGGEPAVVKTVAGVGNVKPNAY